MEFDAEKALEEINQLLEDLAVVESKLDIVDTDIEFWKIVN